MEGSGGDRKKVRTRPCCSQRLRTSDFSNATKGQSCSRRSQSARQHSVYGDGATTPTGMYNEELSGIVLSLASNPKKPKIFGQWNSVQTQYECTTYVQHYHVGELVRRIRVCYPIPPNIHPPPPPTTTPPSSSAITHRPTVNTGPPRAFHPNGEMSDFSPRVQRRTLRGHRGPVLCLAHSSERLPAHPSPDDDDDDDDDDESGGGRCDRRRLRPHHRHRRPCLLLSGSEDGTARLWDMRTRRTSLCMIVPRGGGGVGGGGGGRSRR